MWGKRVTSNGTEEKEEQNNDTSSIWCKWYIDTPLYIHISHICTSIYIYIHMHIPINRHVFSTFFFQRIHPLSRDLGVAGSLLGSTAFLAHHVTPKKTKRWRQNGGWNPQGLGLVGWCLFFFFLLLLLLLLFLLLFSTNCGEVSVCVVDVGWCWLLVADVDKLWT